VKVAAAIAGLLWLSLPISVLAHAELVTSDPPAGGTLTETPYMLTATFDEELTADGSSIVVVNAAGTEVATGTVSETDEFSMSAQLPNLAPGTYTVRWTAVTADDAAVERGTYTFNVGSSPGSPTPTPAPPPSSSSAGSNDVLIALGLAAILIALVVAFVVLRGRR